MSKLDFLWSLKRTYDFLAENAPSKERYDHYVLKAIKTYRRIKEANEF
jgi:hypothetical protein